MDIDIYTSDSRTFEKELKFIEKIESKNLEKYKVEVILRKLYDQGLLDELMIDLKGEDFSNYLMNIQYSQFYIPNNNFMRSLNEKKYGDEKHKKEFDYDEKLSIINDLLKYIGYSTIYHKGDPTICIFRTA